MTTKYVSANRGNDSTGDGSAATPWKTIGHAVDGTPPWTLDPSNPNFVYLEPGVYREASGIGFAPTASGPLSIVGDCDGAGFTAGGHTPAAVGLVEWRAWTDDATVMNSVCAQVTVNYVTIQGVKFVGGNSANGAIWISGGTNFTLRDCNVIGYFAGGNGYCTKADTTAGVPINLTFDRCQFMTLESSNVCLRIGVQAHTADWLLGSKIVNCSFDGPGTDVYVSSSGGGGTIYPGGMAFQNCTFRGTGIGVSLNIGATALTTPWTVNDCEFLGSILSASGTGQITEDGNAFSTPAGSNASVSAGAHSVFAVCPAVSFGDERLVGTPLRLWGTPSTVSPFNAFGSYGTVPAVDLMNRGRPEGSGSTLPSVGCLERHDTGIQNAVYQDTGSSACLALVGPSSQERLVLVDAASTTITVKVRWDGNHGDTNKPQAILVAEPQIGFAGQTVTATSTGGTGTTPNAYETLTFTAFTPTQKGAVMLRLVSRAAAGNGVAYFDSISL